MGNTGESQNKNRDTELIRNMPWETLYYADLTLQTPFRVNLTAEGPPLICQQILRLLPGKRLVADARWGGQSVIAKLFFNRQEAAAACQRDAYGINTLMAANRLTPNVLYMGAAMGQPCLWILLLEKIHQSKNVLEIWQTKKTMISVLPLMKKITEEIAHQHQAGILQRDLHLKNFLVKQPQIIYSLDGSRIKHFTRPLSKKMSLMYFAVFLGQLGMSQDTLHQALFDVYRQVRGWEKNIKDVKKLNVMIKNTIQQSTHRYSKKIFRNCTQFKKIVSPMQWAIYDKNYKSPDFMEFISNPESVFTKTTTKILKSDPFSTIAKIIIDNRALVIKRYHYRDSFHRLRRYFRKTRVASTWDLAQQLTLLGIRTAKPVACIDNVTLLNGKSYFISEFITGAHVGEYFSSYNKDNAAFLETAEALFSMIKQLKALRMVHGDLKMTNILVEESGLPVFIDLESMSKHRCAFTFKRAFKKDLKLFMRNWENRPSVQQLFEGLAL